MLIYTVAGAVPAKRKPAIESTYFHGGTFVTSVFRRIENNTGQCKHWHIIIDVEYRSTVRAGSRYTPFGIRGNRQACYARISNSARNQLEFNASSFSIDHTSIYPCRRTLPLRNDGSDFPGIHFGESFRLSSLFATPNGRRKVT